MFVTRNKSLIFRYVLAIFGILLVTSVVPSENAKILTVFPMPFHSHFKLVSRLLKELVSRGHEVTVISAFPQKSAIRNWRDISVENLEDILNEKKGHLYDLETQTLMQNVHFMTGIGLTLTEFTLANENVQQLLHSEDEHFDLVIMAQFLNEGLMAIAHHFKVPVVLMSTMPILSWANFMLGHPAPPAYVPNSLTKFTGHMNFFERLCNSFYDLYAILYHQIYILPKHAEFARKYVPGEPNLYEFVSNVSFTLIHAHPSVYDPFPLIPAATNIAGLHVDPPKKLPEDLQKFLDEANQGAVIFSMGSNLKTCDFAMDKRAALFQAFAKLKQRVLLKWECDEVDKPHNVKLMKWLPQSDILAHVNVKAFITHGGLLSTIESVYHGVPLIGIPIFADQKMNMATAVSKGYAILLPLVDLTEESLTAALDEILHNPKYNDNVQRRSKIMQDRPIKPVDEAVYWIEYVIRHQGAPHLRYGGLDLTWYQRCLLDVIAFVSLIIILFTGFIYLIITRIFCCRKCKAHNLQKKNS